MRYLYGAAHEQFKPSALLRHAQLAEAAGFDGIYCTAHLDVARGRGPGNGALPDRASAGTPALKRYHPALVAQGFATLAEMFPGRVFLAMGSGESLNESPLGCDWPDGSGQLAAMEEALAMIRKLWTGATVNGEGRFFRTKNAKPPLSLSAG